MSAKRATRATPIGAREIELEIVSLGRRGDGIGYMARETVFVPYAAPGDRLRIRLEGERDGGRRGRIAAREQFRTRYRITGPRKTHEMITAYRRRISCV